MKRISFFLIALIVLISCFTATAQDNYLERGFRGLVDIGVQAGFGDAKDNYLIQSSFTGGYQINRMLFVGGGIAPSLALYDYGDVETGFVMPIYGALRCDFIDARISPFAEARGGYYITDKSDANGGYAYIGAGCRFNRFSLSAGYSLYIRDGFTGHFTGVKFGFEF